MKFAGGKQRGGQAAGHLRGFIFVHQLVDCRNVGKLLKSCSATLHQLARKAVFPPSQKWLARKIRLRAERAALDLAPFHAEIDLVTALITGDDVELRVD